MFLQVARKTFYERRTWWAVYRAYHRVFLVNLTVFHLMMAQVCSQLGGGSGGGGGGLPGG